VFAVVQTVAFGSFAQGGVTTGERIVLLVMAIVAGFSLVVVASKVRDVEGLKPEDDLKPEAIVKWLNEAPANDSEYVSKKLVAELSRVARSRTESNGTRAATYERVEVWVRLSLIAVASELVVAIIVRI